MDEQRKAVLQAREKHREAIRTARRMRDLAYKEADRQYDLYLEPYREAYNRAQAAWEKEVTA